MSTSAGKWKAVFWTARLLSVFLAVTLAASAWANSRSEKEGEAQRHFRLGRIQYEQGKTLLAIESLEKALSINPKFAEAHNYLGIIYLQASEPGKAAREFKKAVRIDPYFTDAHNHLGLAYRELKKYDRALEQFRIALNDRNYNAPEKVHLNMGHLFLARGMYADAIRSFEQAVAINPSYLRGMLGLGTAYQRSGRADLAEKELRKVVRLGPDSPEAAEARQLLNRQVKREDS
jgi:type IV pilus biogenesis/stability protein PilW